MDNTPSNTQRRFGRVVYYNSRSKQKYGYIEELGIWGQEDVRKNIITQNIRFKVECIRNLSKAMVVKFCQGTIVEYTVQTKTSKKNNSKLLYEAHDMTGLFESYLPFEHGVITFTPYHVAFSKISIQDKKKELYYLKKNSQAIENQPIK